MLVFFNVIPLLEAAHGLRRLATADLDIVGYAPDFTSDRPGAQPKSLSDRKAVWQEEK